MFMKFSVLYYNKYLFIYFNYELTIKLSYWKLLEILQFKSILKLVLCLILIVKYA